MFLGKLFDRRCLRTLWVWCESMDTVFFFFFSHRMYIDPLMCCFLCFLCVWINLLSIVFYSNFYCKAHWSILEMRYIYLFNNNNKSKIIACAECVRLLWCFGTGKAELGTSFADCLKGRYTFGNCQRPVFPLSVPQHKHKITSL